MAKCQYCDEIDLEDRSEQDPSLAYCNYRHEYVDPRGDVCDDYDMTDDDAEWRRDKNRREEEEARDAGNSLCFLTTTVCGILGFPDDCTYLMSLRQFRDNYLQKNPQYMGLLLEYDTVGPMISRALMEEADKVGFAKRLLTNYIAPVCDLLKQKQYEQAIALYEQMVQSLKTFYHLNDISAAQHSDEMTIDRSKLGHGKRRSLIVFTPSA